MPAWNVYEQRNGELRFVGRTDGKSGKAALKNARISYPWLRWPVVHELDINGRQVYRHDNK